MADEKLPPPVASLIPQQSVTVSLPLYVANAHVRDTNIRFTSEGHYYTLMTNACDAAPQRFNVSVTGFVHQFFPAFDAHAIARRMVANPTNLANGAYAGMTEQDIVRAWEENRERAAAQGTWMHGQIENHYNGEATDEAFENSEERKMFLAFDREQVRAHKLSIFRTEWVIYSEELCIAGSIDCVCIDPETGDMVLFDWKRSKKIERENRFRKGLPPLQHMSDCNVSHYALQLNVYKHILERHYGVRVRADRGMALVFLHPLQNGQYVVEWVEDRQKEVVDMLAARRARGEEVFVCQEGEKGDERHTKRTKRDGAAN